MIKKFITLLALVFILVVSSGYSKSDVLVAFGDSNTQGSNWEDNGYAASSKWTSKLSKSHMVINAGVRGNTTKNGMNRFQADVMEKNPKYLTIMFGTNDAVMVNGIPRVSKEKFEENIHYFISRAKEKRIRVVLMTTIPVIEKDYYMRHDQLPYLQYGGARAWHDSYNDIVRKIAKERRIELVDNYRTVIKKAGGETDEKLIASGLIDDSGTHFTPKGANHIFIGVESRLRPFYFTNKERFRKR